MKKILSFLILSWLLCGSPTFGSYLLLPTAWGQTGLYIPSEKPLKPKQLEQAWVNPEEFCLVLEFDAGDSNYRERDLDRLDSAYRIGFDRNNPRFYTITIEGFSDRADSGLMAARVQSVFRYLAMRGDGENVDFPIRYSYNAVHCSCKGDTTELLRYEVPVDKLVYDCRMLTDSRKRLNNTIPLEDRVLVTFRHDPAECIGFSEGCFLPSQDSNIRAYYTQLILPKGCIYAVRGTRDECPPPVTITIDEHLDYKAMVEKYFLVPHRRQIILPVGYVVLKSSFTRQPDECSQQLPDSIFVRFPVTEEQVASKLRIYAKKYSDKGVEYKSLPTKKVKGGPVLMIQAGINVTQFDTLFIAKRIQPEEVRSYLYPADTPTEQGAVTIMEKGEERFYKPFRVGRNGEYEFKKPFRAMLRIVEEAEENLDKPEDTPSTDGDEEL